MTLYDSSDFGTLTRSVATAQRTGVAGQLEQVARAVRDVLHARGATRRVSPVLVRAAERQSTQVDERDARTRDRPGHLPSLSAFHHARAVERRTRLAAAPGRDPRAQGDGDSRRDELSEAGSSLRRGCAPVLRRVGQGCQLPGRGDGGALDG